MYAHLRELAARNVSAEDELSFLGAGMYDHYVPALIDMLMRALGVPHPLHPLPAGDQPGRAAGDVRVPDRDLRADRPAGVRTPRCTRARAAVAAAGYLAKLHNGRTRFVVSAGLHPHSIETLRTYAHGYGMERRRGAPRRRRSPTAQAWAAAIDGDTQRRDLRPAQLLRRGRGRRGAERGRRWRDREDAARGRRPGRPDHARHPGARRASAASTWPSARVSRSATVWTSAGPRSDSSRPARSICAGCPAGSRGRPRTSTAGAGSC